MKFSGQKMLRAIANVKVFSNEITNRLGVRCIFLTGARTTVLNHVDASRVKGSKIIDKLTSDSIPFVDGYACVYLKNCSFCSCKTEKGPSNSSSSDIFINKRTGYFLCMKCNISGSWNDFNELVNTSKSNRSGLHLFKKKFTRTNKEVEGWSEIVKKTVTLDSLESSKYLNVFEKFNLICCSKHYTRNLGIRVNNEENMLYFPLFNSNKDVVGYKTYNCKGETNTFPKSDCPGFILHSNLNKEVIVVADIPDFFAVLSVNASYKILCLPYGTMTLPQSTLPFLECYDKLLLWLGNYGPSDSSVQFAAKLGARRCYIVRPVGMQKSPLIALSKKQNLSLILSQAKPAWHESVTTFQSLREEVLEEFLNGDRVCGVQWKRFPSLNSILKGHRRGELTLVTGPTGCGKTTFMSEYSLDLAMQGVNTLWGSFEVKNARLAKTMIQQFAGMSLVENIKDFDVFADKFEQLPLFFLTFHGQHNLQIVMDAIEHCAYTYDIAHVIIDNVQFMIEVGDYSTDRFWRQDCIIQAFRNFATVYNCHVTLVMHPRKEVDDSELGLSSIFGGAKATQEADNVLILQSKKVTFAQSRKFLQICKNRFSGDLGAISLDFNKKNLTFRQRRENEGQKFNDFRKEHSSSRRLNDELNNEDCNKLCKSPYELM